MGQQLCLERRHFIVLEIEGYIPPYECREYINQQQPADDNGAVTPGVFIKLKAQSVKRKAFLNLITIKLHFQTSTLPYFHTIPAPSLPLILHLTHIVRDLRASAVPM